MSNKAVAIITARSMSRSIKDKSIQPVGGIPMLGHAVCAARESRFLDRVIVSTDSPKYQEIARSYGAETPFLRPKRLAMEVPSEWVVRHALKTLRKQKYAPDLFVLLQPTTPFTLGSDIDMGLNLLEARSFLKRVVSVRQAQRPEWMFTTDPSGRLVLILKAKSMAGHWGIKQWLGKTYALNGGFYIGPTKPYLSGRCPGFIDKATGYVEMPADRSVDVDTPANLAYLNYLSMNKYSWLIRQRKKLAEQAR